MPWTHARNPFEGQRIRHLPWSPETSQTVSISQRYEDGEVRGRAATINLTLDV